MDNYDMITSAHNNLLVTQYDIMYSHMNDLEYLKDADDTTLKFIEFRKSCTIPINTFDEKVAFMRQFYDKIEQEKKKEEIERLKKEKAKLIELAKERYASKSFFWKLSFPIISASICSKSQFKGGFNNPNSTAKCILSSISPLIQLRLIGYISPNLNNLNN